MLETVGDRKVIVSPAVVSVDVVNSGACAPSVRRASAWAVRVWELGAPRACFTRRPSAWSHHLLMISLIEGHTAQRNR